MDDAELERLLRDLESDRVERKRSLADGDRIREAICAFANDLPDHRQPGVVFVGVNDDGTCANATIDDQFLRSLADAGRDGSIVPFPTMTVQKKVLLGCQLAVVTVSPSYFPPVRCKGWAWIRIGPRRAAATPEEEMRLAEKRRAFDLPYDIQPVPTASIDDLDTVLFERTYLPAAVGPDVLAENRRTVTAQMRSLRLLAPDGTPTVLGLLVLASDPTTWLPGAYVQFRRVDGSEITDPNLDQKELAGPLDDMLRMLDETLVLNISTRSDPTGSAREIRRMDYPIEALRQVARNAILHRRYDGTGAPVRVTWFADRVEIQSPGGPFGQVTPENFGQAGVTDYRNPHLAEAMKVLGYVQRFGLGIPLTRKSMEDNGNPPPEFDVRDTYVVANLRRTP